MGPPGLPLLLTLALVALCPAGAVDFTTACPAVCDCKWVSGNKAADCADKGLSTIPDKLNNDIQNLDLSGNPLYEITQGAFQMVGLSNLKKLILRNCNIITIHKNGFNSLGIIIEIDLSKNNIKTLHPDTFNHTEKLRWIYLNNNQLEKIDDGVFRNLPFLQKIDLSHNQIHRLGVRAFSNLPAVKMIRLAYNNLTHVKIDTINQLRNLSSLDLHNNPWKCDCNLQPFRDWIIDHNLYTSPTSCAEPPQLHKVLWSNTDSSDFACTPSIIEPLHNNKMQAVGENVTLSCKAIGNPLPDVTWVQNSRVIDGDARRSGDQRYHIQHSGADMARWVNLTITHVKFHDRGEYTCVAKNPAGVEERTIVLAVSRTPGAAGAGIGGSDMMSVVIGFTCGAIVLMVIIAVLCFCFCRRRDSKRHMKSDMHSSNGEALIEGSVIPEMEKSLITTVNPVTKPPRIYDAPPSVMSGATEMSELNKTLLDNDSVFAPNEDESRSMDFVDQQPKRSREALLGDHHSANSILHSRAEPRAYPPDLLSFPPRAAQASPASSSASTAPDMSRLPPQPQVHSPLQSPIYGTNPNMFRTLPYSRSQSPFTSPVCPPVVTPRQGYVTIPRRPRVPSWSSTASTITPVVPGEYVEPVYDNLGLRTTADGSSVLSLNKAGLEQQFSPMRGRPLPATPGSYHGPLPVLYTPIEEQERAPSPAPSSVYSSTLPKMNGNSLHLQLTPNSAEPQEPITRRLKNTPETGILKRFTHGEIDRQSPAPSLMNGRIYDTASANNDTLGRSGKVPPRPPPKPKKKSPTESGGPLFEDEGEDGTEV